MDQSFGNITDVLERIADAFIALNKNWCYTYMNKKAGEVFNRDPGKIIGKNIWAEFPESIDQPFYKTCHRAMAEQCYVSIEEYYPLYNRWFESHIYPLPDGLFVFFRDTTERKKAEEKLVEQEMKLRLLVENSPAALVVLDVEDGKFVSVSESAIMLFKMSRDQLLKTGPAELSPEYQPDGKLSSEAAKEKIKDAIKGLKPSFEWTHIDGEGNLIPCEVRLARLPSKDKFLIQGNIIDITEQKKVQELILKEKQLSNEIIDSIPGVFFLRDKNNFIRWNKQFETISGYSSEEISKIDPITTFLTGEEKERMYEHQNRLFTEGSSFIEASPLTKDGNKKPYYFNSRLITYEGRQCIIGTAIDISDRKKAEEQIKQTTEQLRQLSAHLQNIREDERTRISREIHDELGQQLTVMKMDVSWLSKRLKNKDDDARKKTEDLKNMLDQTVKTVRRISAELRPSMIDDMGLIAALEWHLAEFEKRSGIKTEFNKTETEILFSDAVKIGLFRIVQESLTNVARHAKAKKVNVSLHLKNKQVVLTIKDDGSGFNREKILSKNTLGIIGMKERSFMLGGTYNIDSSLGKGTCVTVIVPFEE